MKFKKLLKLFNNFYKMDFLYSNTLDYNKLNLSLKKPERIKEICIYVLKCEKEKYYVGKSTNINKRLKQHFKQKKGACWTRLYRPLQIYEIRRNCDEFDEEKITLQYMKKFGINNVRGGSYTRLQLSNYEINHLVRLIRSSEDRCFVCGSREHFAKQCEKLSCKKCKKNGHSYRDCRFYDLENKDNILTDKQIEEFIVDSDTDKIYNIVKPKFSLFKKLKNLIKK